MTWYLEDMLLASDELVRARREMGDDVAVVRNVDHTITFRRLADARAVADQLTRVGYATSVTRRWRWAGTPSVLAARESTVDRATIEAMIREIVAVVEPHGGVYDGWGAMLVGTAAAG